MKKFLFLVGALLLFSLVKAQSPSKISYQAVVRGASNNLIFNSMVSMRFSVLQGSDTGVAIYVETQKPTTNDNGLISVVIGNGVPGSGDMSTIDWSKGPFFLKVETNPLGGSNYTVTGTTQLFSVPYALYSGQADNVSGTIKISHGGTGASNVTGARFNLGLDIDSARVAAADALLTTNLNAEQTRASGAEATLTNNLATEVTRATGAETTLTTNLTTEVTRAKSAEGTLTTNLATEITNRTNADTLKEDLANKSTNVTTDATSDIKYPSVKSVKTYVDASSSAVSTALATEITNRMTGDATLTANLNAEATRASGSETTLTNNLGNEVTRATGAETTLTSNLASEVTNRTTADALKEDRANKSTNVTTDGTSDTKYPSVKSVKSYVDAAITTATPDADATTKGKMQLAGDLGGTAALPTVLTVGGSAASTINAATTMANAATNTNTISTIVKRDASGNFSAGTIAANLTGNATNVTGTVAVANGGTGATTLTGYVKGNGTNSFSTVSNIPSADITGLVTKVNGTLPGVDGNVSITFGHVTSGILSSKPADGTGANGDIFVVAGDGTLSNNGRTYIYNGTNWNETSTNQATTDARYLQLAGGTLSGNLIIPANDKITLTDSPRSGTDAANKDYVDTTVSSATISDATVSVKGKLQLAGDLGGTAAAPTVPGLLLKANVESPTFTGTVGGIDKTMVGLGNAENTSDANKAISTAAQTALDFKEDLANKATTTTLGTSDVLYPTQNAVKTYVDATVSTATPDANATTKGKMQLAGDLGGTAALPTVLTVGGSAASTINAATTLVNAATNSNTVSTIVKRDAVGNFSAGTIAANLTGDVTGNATNVTGTVAVANGGTGATTLTGYVKGNGTNPFSTVSTIPSTDITGLVTRVNGTSPGADGNVSIVFGHVTSGSLGLKPADGIGANGDIFVVAGDGTLSNNGRTFIYNGTTWNEINTNQATTDARYLQLAGGTLSGNLVIPANDKITLAAAPISGTDAANKDYVDTKVSSATVADATISVKGKLQLAGDLGGTAAAPTVPGLALKANIESPAFTGTVGGIDKTMVGLGNVDNTSDANNQFLSLHKQH